MSDWLLTHEARLAIDERCEEEVKGTACSPRYLFGVRVAKAQHEKTYPWAVLEGMQAVVQWLKRNSVSLEYLEAYRNKGHPLIVAGNVWLALKREVKDG